MNSALIKNTNNNLADKTRGVTGDKTSSVIDHAVTLRNIRNNPPTQVTIADLFHRKLYDYADFDFLISYLRNNGIAECKNIHTLKSLASDVVPSLTEAALRDRDVRKVNAAYAGIMRLCKRHRKGLLAYLSVEGHAQVCLIKSWDRFLELAGFSSTASADSLLFNTEDIFPRLRINRSIRARIESSGEQTLATTATINTPSSVQIEQNLNSNSEQFSVADIQIAVSDSRTSTSLFRSGEDVDAAQLLAMTYHQVYSDSFEWDTEHDSDLFTYFVLSRAYPEYSAITSVKEFCTMISQLFSSVQFVVSPATLKQLSGDRLMGLKSVLGITTTEINQELDETFDLALRRLAAQHLVFETDVTASYKAIYENEIRKLRDKRQEITNKLKGTNSLITPITDSDLLTYTKIVPEFKELVAIRNDEIFKHMWKAAMSRNLVDLAVDGFNKIVCLVVYDRTKQVDMTLAALDSEIIKMFNEFAGNSAYDWVSIINQTSGEVMSISRIVRAIPDGSGEYNKFMCDALKSVVSQIYNFKIAESDMWQQVYIGICNAKSNSAPGLSEMSGAEALGLDDTFL